MRNVSVENTGLSVLIFWIAAGWAGFCLLPWYGIEDGFFSFAWLLDGYPLDEDYAPAAFLIAQSEKMWLAPLIAPLLAPLFVLRRRKSDPVYSATLILAGGLGFAWLIAQGFGIGIRGFSYEWLNAVFGELGDRQFGMGYGALLVATAFLFLFTQGIAARGAINGDVFVVSAIGGVIIIVATFVFFPIVRMLVAAFVTDGGHYSITVFVSKFFDDRLWGLGCFWGARCGAAWNSLFLAVLVGIITTGLGLVFALVVTRSGFRFKRGLRALTVLPIITPPFVIGLALILLFGLSGSVTVFVSELFGIQPTRWLYGLPGILIAQTLAFTPIAFLVLIGVVEGVSPSMEEAAQTLRANRWQTFKTVSLPLMRPGLANAFLLGFIESMADFGNPLVLGGNFDVLSTEIFFAIVGAQYDQSRAAVLAMVLLFFTLTAFYFQRVWLGKKNYTTVTGKGDAGVHPLMPRRLSFPVFAVAGIWGAFTIIVYGMIVYGSFVELWGVRNTLTFKHYITAFSVGWTEHGLHWSGAAWDSFFTTIQIAAAAAPLTAAVGLITAYLLTRQTFAGKNAFEFGTMLSFAIPGTVIGVSYILAFNVPPIEITGTGIILVVSFIFRNMPVGVRAGIASMSQLDKSLDESSLTLGANSWQTFRKVILPLLRPAILAALVFSFVRAMTAISAVIFLVSAEYDMATSYIIGRVENNDYGLAIAYSTTLIFVMLSVVALLQFIVGRTQIGRRTQFATRT
ncbi:MAG: iron ABC transporter permease [Roseibium album]|uniref:Sulfate transport system permease protein CysW n=1 Tax=Roseibium album TaxID=311410 RepID=A0A0M7ARQ0_9HYPH|nr:iron ABC transporter permease [Roseibium album]MBG6146381.1 iron(III) transport system permease protein [Labrenzia sp. EL_142]MBG6156622.1 iron(III) transport system permease protein [Labrenzia sp. EL_162]MBG6173355.1 iron(III) transport system permease protein [Labrenzia sp. EL_132]MBG6195438.1 iron(III) transport system permease protein [Labrenzia sp. EL_159]MBG6227875.1 iron(III) transport system permease protein [Labrenzia sp. EL_208]